MPRPIDPFDLVPYSTRSQLPKHWVDEFGEYCWTYVVGLREIAHLANERSIQPFKDCRTHAIRSLPDAWRQSYPKGEFSKFNATQIMSAKASQPLRFDKALLVVLAVEEFVKVSGLDNGFDVYEHIQLRPSVFQIDGLHEDAFENIKNTPGVIDEMKQRIQYPFDDEVLFREVCRGRAAMEHIIDIMLSVCADHKVEIGKGKRVFTDRTDGGRLTGKKKPADAQVAFLDVDGVEPCRARSISSLKGSVIL